MPIQFVDSDWNTFIRLSTNFKDLMTYKSRLLSNFGFVDLSNVIKLINTGSGVDILLYVLFS